jgi:hypothetical protein
MTANEFRALALSFPETAEQAHMDHPDFRVGGKIFATLGPDAKWGIVKLKPDQQAALMRAEPTMFEPASGTWGERGATIVKLRGAKEAIVRDALEMAWRNTAPKRLQK